MPQDIFESLDYEGRPVRLSDDCWERHIVNRHPEVEPYCSLIAQVIEYPNIVTRDQAGVYHFSRFGITSEGRFQSLYLEVVVRYERHSDTEEGEVATVHFNARIPKGEIVWIRK